MKETSAEANKRIVKNSLFLYVRMIFIMGITLYTSRVVLRILGVDDFGIYNVVGGIVVMLGFLNQTLSVGSQRFIAFSLGKHDKELMQQTFSTSLFVYAVLIVGLLVLSETLGLWYVNNVMVVPPDRLFAANVVFQCSIVSCCFSFFQVPFLAEVIAHENMSYYAAVSVIEAILKLCSVFVLNIIPADHLIVYAFLLLITQFFVFFMYFSITLRNYEVHISFVPENKMIKSMLSFCGWNMFGSVSSVFSTQGVNIILNFFFGPACNAARGIAIQVNNAVNMFVSSFQTAVNPRITKLYANGDFTEEYVLISRSSKFSFILVSLVVIPLLLNMDIVLQIWLGTVPSETGLFCEIVLMQSVVLSIDRPVVIGIYATGKMKLANLTSGILYLINFPLSYLLLKLGYEAYSVFVIAAVLQPFILITDLLVLRKYTKFPIKNFLSKIVFPSILIFLVVIITTFYTFYFCNISLLRLIGSTFVGDSFFCLMAYFLILTRRERDILVNTIKFKLQDVCR